jgi:outer membrane receptor protein involved in Fe transport
MNLNPPVPARSFAALLAVIAATGLAVPLQAQVSPEQDGYLEEVYVFAQKRTQNLQQVPVAVTAFSGEELVTSGIEDVFDLSKITPGLDVRQAANARATTFRIRGIGTYAINFGMESSVGLYVDGVYRSRQGSMINSMVDLQSVEVLRGPQGTLFGRNTLAGAVQMKTAAPSHEDGDGFAAVEAGNYDLMKVSAANSFSAIEDVLALRVSAFSTQRDGFVDDIHLGDDKINDRDRWGVRLQGLYTPSDSVSVRVIADYSEINETCCAALVMQDNLRPVALPEGATSYAGTDEVIRSLGGTVFPTGQFYDYETAYNALPSMKDEDGGLSVTVDWDLDSVSLTSITAYRSYESDESRDSDSTDLMILSGGATADQNAWSQELRLSRETEHFSYVAGLYYFSQDLDSDTVLEFGEDANGIYSHTAVWFADDNGQFPLEAIDSFPLPSLPLFYPGTGTRNVMKQDHEAYAIFGQADYYLTDTVMLTGGLRYTREDKDLDGKFTQGNAPDFQDDSPVAQPFVVEGFPAFQPQDPVDESLNDDKITGNVKVSWLPNDNTLVYASYGTGYKSGGTNTERIDPALDYVFDPETSEAFEVGLKTEFPEQALRLNLALHVTHVDDLQVDYFDGESFVLQNAGKLETYGGELEVSWLPYESLLLSGSYARTEGEFKDFDGGLCWAAAPFHTGEPDPGDASNGADPVACDRSGDDLHNNPDFLLLSANQSFAVVDGVGGYFLAEYTRIGSADSTSQDPFHRASSYDLLNLRLGFEFESYNAELILWGRNVLDEEYRMTGYDAPTAPGKVLATPGAPVTYGVTLRKAF